MKKNKPVNILFLGGAKRVSLGERFIESAKNMNERLNIFSYELNRHVPISSLANIIIGLKWGDKRILDHLSKIIAEFNIDIVLPFVDGSTVIAAKLKKKHKDIFIPVSDESVCNTFFDKVIANRWFVKNGFPVPKGTDQPPLIAKPRKGSASKDIIIISNHKELKIFINNFNKKDYLIQRFIKGEEYSVDCYISIKGDILAVVPRRRIEVISGEVTKSVTIKDYKIIEFTNKILRICKFKGPLTMQFIKEEKTTKLFIMEINPRFGGGVIVSIEAGADIPTMILKDYFGIANKPVYDWKEHLLMTRAYREVFQYANNC